MNESSIITIESTSQIKAYLKTYEETLIVFDVDYVLTHPAEPCYQFPNFIRYKESAKKAHDRLTPVQRDLFSSLMVFDDKGAILIEEQTPKIIQELQSKHYKVIALTATLTCDLEGKNLKKARYDNLKKMGIDFSHAFPSFANRQFKELPSSMNCFPEFYNGILLTNGENKQILKGQLLKAFLKEANFNPKYIVVVDDRKINLETIIKDFENSSIIITGLHYTGHLSYPSLSVEHDHFYNKCLNLAEKAKEVSKNYSSS